MYYFSVILDNACKGISSNIESMLLFPSRLTIKTQLQIHPTNFGRVDELNDGFSLRKLKADAIYIIPLFI